MNYRVIRVNNNVPNTEAIDQMVNILLRYLKKYEYDTYNYSEIKNLIKKFDFEHCHLYCNTIIKIQKCFNHLTKKRLSRIKKNLLKIILELIKYY